LVRQLRSDYFCGCLKKAEMRGRPDDNYRVGKYSVELDLTEVLGNVLDSLGKQPEKHLLDRAIATLSKHQIEFTKVLGQVFPELAKQLPKFFQKRVEDHRHAMRVRKLFGFRSLSSIEEEAVRRAWEDTRAMVREVSMLHDESVRALVDDHREILRRLCGAMVELIMQEQNAGVNLDFDKLGKFLGGERT